MSLPSISRRSTNRIIGCVISGQAASVEGGDALRRAVDTGGSMRETSATIGFETSFVAHEGARRFLEMATIIILSRACGTGEIMWGSCNKREQQQQRARYRNTTALALLHRRTPVVYLR
jgi:hypothetical protein